MNADNAWGQTELGEIWQRNCGHREFKHVCVAELLYIPGGNVIIIYIFARVNSVPLASQHIAMYPMYTEH